MACLQTMCPVLLYRILQICTVKLNTYTSCGTSGCLLPGLDIFFHTAAFWQKIPDLVNCCSGYYYASLPSGTYNKQKGNTLLTSQALVTPLPGFPTCANSRACALGPRRSTLRRSPNYPRAYERRPCYPTPSGQGAGDMRRAVNRHHLCTVKLVVINH